MQLYPDQIPALDALKEVYTSRRDYSTLTAVTGYGKTTIGFGFVKWLLENTDETIWFVLHTKSLVMQWWLTAKAWGVQEDVGIMWADCPKEDKDGSAMPLNQLTRRVQITTLQTLGSKKNERSLLSRLPVMPTVVIADEIHETYNYRVLAELWKLAEPLKIGLTGTPLSHPKARVSFESMWPKANWITTKPAAQMIEDGRWSKIEYKLPSEGLQAKIAERFAGMHMNPSGEYSTTRQRDVFVDMHQAIVLEWMQAGLHNESTGFVCCDIITAKKVCGFLQMMGVQPGLLIGSTKDPLTMLDNFRDGTLKCLVTVDCFITGVDAPIAAVCVIMKLFGNLAQYHQLIGRFVRLYESKARALIFDCAGNSMHEPPEAIMDWRDYDSGSPRHYDADSEVCAECGHKHPGIPRPILAEAPKTVFHTSVGTWVTGEAMKYNHPLNCHGCGAAVTVDLDELGEYTNWLTEARTAFAKGTVPNPFNGGKGIYVGGEGLQLTGGMLYEFGVWKLKDGGSETTEMVDRSEEFIERMRGCSEMIDAMELGKIKVKYMEYSDQQLFKTASFSQLVMRASAADGITALTEHFMLSYLHGPRQKALTKAKACRITHGLDHYEVAEAANNAIRRLSLCPVSHELVANWVARLSLDNVRAEKTVVLLRDALYAGLCEHDPATPQTFHDRAIMLLDAAKQVA
jgi:superfamily II DNA or RNA helicase